MTYVAGACAAIMKTINEIEAILEGQKSLIMREQGDAHKYISNFSRRVKANAASGTH